MSKMIKKIEVASNICILVLAIILGAVLVRNFLFHDSSDDHSEQETKRLKQGYQLGLTEINWKENGQTMLLALSPDCHYCSESKAFYKELLEKNSKYKSTKVIAVFPKSTVGEQKYLDELGLTVDEVKRVSFSELGVRGTPTIILLDKNGTVKNFWEGKIPSSKEAEALEEILHKTTN